jgi:hypothetical protein
VRRSAPALDRRRRRGGARVIRGSMAIVHMSEAEVARDLHAALANAEQGVEIVIEQDQSGGTDRAGPSAHRRADAARARSPRPQVERVYRHGEGIPSEAWLCAGPRRGLREGCASGYRRPPRLVQASPMGLVLDPSYSPTSACLSRRNGRSAR